MSHAVGNPKGMFSRDVAQIGFDCIEIVILGCVGFMVESFILQGRLSD